MTDATTRLPTRGEQHCLRLLSREQYALLATLDMTGLHAGRYRLIERGPDDNGRRLVATWSVGMVFRMVHAGWIVERGGEWAITERGIAAKDGEAR